MVALGRLRQKDLESKASLSYREKLCLQRKERREGGRETDRQTNVLSTITELEHSGLEECKAPA
jgi:hypothetical protein